MTWQPSSTVSEDWGRLQVIVGGRDVTFLRDVPCVVESWEDAEPFGYGPAVIAFPQVTPFEQLGVGDLAPFTDWADVEIRLIRPDDTTKVLWEGLWASDETSHDETSGNFVLHCMGALFEADLCLAPPPFARDARDVGALIFEALSAQASWRFFPPALLDTGVPAVPQGSWNPVLTGLVQDYLAEAYDDATGHQWTVASEPGRHAVLRLKDRSTVHWTLTTGTPGLRAELARDLTMVPNVIYGEGDAKPTDPKIAQYVALGHWRNAKYPNLHPDTAPVWPGTLISVGHSGSDVVTWKRRMRDTGWRVTSGSTYTSADAKVCRAFQASAGITVDGVVGPQTWAATFQPGSNGGSLDGAYIAPLAEDPQVEPWLHNAYGAYIGTNPAFDIRTVRVERYENFGRAQKEDAVASAAAELAREATPGYVGTLTLRIDPEEGSRYEMRAGQNVLLKSWRGADVLLHIARVAVDIASLTVTLTVDEHARDLPTLEAVRQRRRDTSDPTRRIRPARNHSRLTPDLISGIDLEAGGGVIPRMGLYRGLWSVIHVPVGDAGTIGGLELTLDDQLEFVVALFDRPITAAELVSKGVPIADRYWSAANWDEDSGLLAAYGEGLNLAGWYPYDPHENESDDGDPAAHVTGRLFENSGVSYASQRPPWLWVCMWSTDTTYIQGRLFPGPTGG